MFGDLFSNPGSMPNTLPGMSPRLSTTWASRQRQGKGFNKNQILEVESCRQRQVGLNIQKLSGKSSVPNNFSYEEPLYCYLFLPWPIFTNLA